MSHSMRRGVGASRSRLPAYWFKLILLDPSRLRRMTHRATIRAPRTAVTSIPKKDTERVDFA